jgi:hypothetical protein
MHPPRKRKSPVRFRVGALAQIAHQVEHLTCNQKVAGSSPALGSRRTVMIGYPILRVPGSTPGAAALWRSSSDGRAEDNIDPQSLFADVHLVPGTTRAATS